MSDKIHVLPKKEKKEKWEHLKEGMIKCLEGEIEKVKSGRVSGLSIIREENGLTGQTFYGKVSNALIGEMEFVKYMMLQNMNNKG
jgi:hypothetical protein